MKSIKITLSFLVILCSFSVEAKMNKCTDSKGKVSYGSSPCQQGQQQKVIKKPYFNEESRQEEVAIVADRRATISQLKKLIN